MNTFQKKREDDIPSSHLPTFRLSIPFPTHMYPIKDQNRRNKCSLRSQCKAKAQSRHAEERKHMAEILAVAHIQALGEQLQRHGSHDPG